MNSTNIIIQARIGSKRLPRKIMMEINGYPIIYWIYHRCSKIENKTKLIFAIPDNEENDELNKYLLNIGAIVFRGSEQNVLERFCKASNKFKSDNIVRVCADNPFICPIEVDKLINIFNCGNYDYAYNHIPLNNKYPDGLGAEICKSKLIREFHKKNFTNLQKEHIFNYIHENNTKFNIKTFDPIPEIAFPKIKLDIDSQDDYNILSKINFSIDMDATSIVSTYLDSDI